MRSHPAFRVCLWMSIDAGHSGFVDGCRCHETYPDCNQSCNRRTLWEGTPTPKRPPFTQGCARVTAVGGSSTIRRAHVMRSLKGVLSFVSSSGERSDSMIIHWWDVSKSGLADGNLRSPNTPLRLRSEHHYQPPVSYEIYRLPPKWLRKLCKSKWVTTIGAGVAAAPPSSVYWSTEEWPLDEPEPENIVSFFKARAINQKGKRIRGRSTLIRSSLLSIDEQQRSRTVGGGAGAIVHAFNSRSARRGRPYPKMGSPCSGRS